MMAKAKIKYTPPVTKALTLDGAHFLSLDSSAFNFGTDDFAIDFLARIDADTPDAVMLLAGKRPATWANNAGYCLVSTKADRSLSLILNDGQVTELQVDSDVGVYEFGSWFWGRVEADRDGQATFYVNGVAVGGGDISSYAGSLDNAELLRVGGYDASTNRLKGALDFLRFDPGRLLTQGWRTEEWDRLRFGMPRFCRDFLEFWDFEQSLTGSSTAARVLTYNGGGDPAYEDGYPTAAAPLEVEFERDIESKYEEGFLLAKDMARALDGTANTYLVPLKKRFLMSFISIPLSQYLVLQAADAGGEGIEFFKDGDLPHSCIGIFESPLAFTEDFIDQWSGDAVLVEV